jgi:hypothetical protein
VFPNKNELQRMVQWGVVQSKFNNVKIIIGEKMIENKVVKILQKFGSNLMDFQLNYVIFHHMGGGLYPWHNKGC